MLKSDLYPILVSCINGQLESIDVEFHQERFAVGVVLASGGYPEAFEKGFAISGDWSTLLNFFVGVNHSKTKDEVVCMVYI
jgi:phosphoribosylamine-glycine ligase